MYGEYEGSHGSFPTEYVQPIVGLRATKEAIEVWSLLHTVYKPVHFTES